ncbi:unnamed protein product [Closterium sp. NIES-65]|nr:unnamed protein product [Closterium sp. NIES-65]
MQAKHYAAVPHNILCTSLHPSAPSTRFFVPLLPSAPLYVPLHSHICTSLHPSALHLLHPSAPHQSPFKGPFLCPSHTQCHSCGSKVPGSGTSSRCCLNYMFCHTSHSPILLSPPPPPILPPPSPSPSPQGVFRYMLFDTLPFSPIPFCSLLTACPLVLPTARRWFFNYMLCDACGRLFVKKKHCPVCLRGRSTWGRKALLGRVQPGWGSWGGAAGVGQLGWGSWGGAAGVGQLGWGSWGGAAGVGQLGWGSWGGAAGVGQLGWGSWGGAAGVGQLGGRVGGVGQLGWVQLGRD